MIQTGNDKAKPEKLSGMEMMMNSVMRAAGFDPKLIADGMTKVVHDIQNGLMQVADSLKSIHDEQKVQRLLLEKISRDNEILKNAAGIVDRPALPSPEAGQPPLEN